MVEPPRGVKPLRPAIAASKGMINHFRFAGTATTAHWNRASFQSRGWKKKSQPKSDDFIFRKYFKLFFTMVSCATVGITEYPNHMHWHIICTLYMAAFKNQNISPRPTLQGGYAPGLHPSWHISPPLCHMQKQLDEFFFVRAFSI